LFYSRETHAKAWEQKREGSSFKSDSKQDLSNATLGQIRKKALELRFLSFCLLPAYRLEGGLSPRRLT
jgi:hypothetical protein